MLATNHKTQHFCDLQLSSNLSKAASQPTTTCRKSSIAVQSPRLCFKSSPHRLDDRLFLVSGNRLAESVSQDRMVQLTRPITVTFSEVIQAADFTEFKSCPAAAVTAFKSSRRSSLDNLVSRTGRLARRPGKRWKLRNTDFTGQQAPPRPRVAPRRTSLLFATQRPQPRLASATAAPTRKDHRPAPADVARPATGPPERERTDDAYPPRRARTCRALQNAPIRSRSSNSASTSCSSRRNR